MALVSVIVYLLMVNFFRCRSACSDKILKGSWCNRWENQLKRWRTWILSWPPDHIHFMSISNVQTIGTRWMESSKVSHETASSWLGFRKASTENERLWFVGWNSRVRSWHGNGRCNGTPNVTSCMPKRSSENDEHLGLLINLLVPVEYLPLGTRFVLVWDNDNQPNHYRQIK